MIQEYKGTNTKYNKVAWIIYICFILFISAMAFVRLICLFRRIEWRNDLGNTFPASCGDWASEHGCTRVTLEADGCMRPGSITTSNSLVFDENVDRLLNTQIEMCINTLDGAKLMNPDNLSKMDTHNNLIHVTFNSAIFGFLDDMYIITNEYIPEGITSPWRKLSIMCQLRMGKYDFDLNYDRVKNFLDCLNDTFENADQGPDPCSQ